MQSNPLNPAKLQTIISDFPRKKILVVGDLILDQYLWGKVERISPEAPVPVVNVVRKEFRLGGAGNVAANLASLGCRVTVAGICGADYGKEAITSLLSQNGITPIILTSDQRPTTVKTRVVAHHQQVVRIDEEDPTTIGKELRRELLSRIREALSSCNGIIISDYAKGLVTEDVVAEIIQNAHSLPVLIDPKGYHYKKYQGATAIKPNFKEFCAAVRHPDLKIEDMDAPARQLVADLKLSGIIVTLGEDGVYVLDDKQAAYRLPTRVREVFDVSGAGDTFIAAFCAALLASNDWRIAAEVANLASGIAVGKVGTATVKREELLAGL